MTKKVFLAVNYLNLEDFLCFGLFAVIVLLHIRIVLHRSVVPNKREGLSSGSQNFHTNYHQVQLTCTLIKLYLISKVPAGLDKNQIRAKLGPKQT